MQTLIIEPAVKFEVSSKLYEQVRRLPFQYDYARCIEEKDGTISVRNDNLDDSQKTLEAILAFLLHDFTNYILRESSPTKMWSDERLLKISESRANIEKSKREGKNTEAYWQTIDLLGEILSYRFQIERQPSKPYTIKQKV